MDFANVANCQSTIYNRNDAAYYVYNFVVEDMKSDMESIRQVLMNLQKAAARIETHTVTIQEMKSEIETIRQIAIQLQNHPKKSL